jgi:hypothetical protein
VVVALIIVFMILDGNGQQANQLIFAVVMLTVMITILVLTNIVAQIIDVIIQMYQTELLAQMMV